jgi:hypothetical protein
VRTIGPYADDGRVVPGRTPAEANSGYASAASGGVDLALLPVTALGLEEDHGSSHAIACWIIQ